MLALASFGSCNSRLGEDGTREASAHSLQTPAITNDAAATSAVNRVPPLLFGPQTCATLPEPIEMEFLGGESNLDSVRLTVDRVEGSAATVNIDLNGRRVIEADDLPEGARHIERVIGIFSENSIRIEPVNVTSAGVTIRVIGHLFAVPEFTVRPATTAYGRRTLFDIRAKVVVPRTHTSPDVYLERVGPDGIRVSDIASLSPIGRTESGDVAEYTYSATTRLDNSKSGNLIFRLRLVSDSIVEYSAEHAADAPTGGFADDSEFMASFQEQLLTSFQAKSAEYGHEHAARAILEEARSEKRVARAILSPDCSLLTIEYRSGIEGVITLTRPPPY